MRQSPLLKVAILGVAGAFLLALAPLPARDVAASLGSAAPDFTLNDQDGNKVSLSDYKGKIIVLEWFNFDCPFVQRHYKSETMSSLANKFRDKGVVWLAINSTDYVSAAENKTFKEKHDLPYPILSDTSGEVGKMYGAKTTPHMYIINKDGKLVYAGGIDDDPRGETEEAHNYVKKALEEIVAGKRVSTPESTPYGCSVKYAKK